MTSSSIDKKEVRRFGLIAFLLFGCLAGLGFWRQKLMPTYGFGFLSLLGIGFVLLPELLRPVYNRWLRVAHFVGQVVTLIVLTLAYFLVITPSALIKRLFGGRPLPVRPDTQLSSYWVKRADSAQPRERFIKRY